MDGEDHLRRPSLMLRPLTSIGEQSLADVRLNYARDGSTLADSRHRFSTSLSRLFSSS